MTRHGSILVVDDEEIMREILETLLTREGFQVRLASTGAEGLDLARAMPFDAAIVDVMMPGIDGIATLEELKSIDEDLPVVMVTAFASIETAIAAMKRGALDYITKPFKNDEVLVVLRNALERRQLVSENRALRQNLQTRYHKFANIIGRSPRMRAVFDYVRVVADFAPMRDRISRFLPRDPLLAWLSDGWMHVKLLAAFTIFGFHMAYGRWRRHFEEDRNEHTVRFYKILNEIPAVLLIVIVIMVIVKPF